MFEPIFIGLFVTIVGGIVVFLLTYKAKRQTVIIKNGEKLKQEYASLENNKKEEKIQNLRIQALAGYDKNLHGEDKEVYIAKYMQNKMIEQRQLEEANQLNVFLILVVILFPIVLITILINLQ